MSGSDKRQRGRRKGPGVSLKMAVAKLVPLYPSRDPLTDPISILVWENIGYLIDDTRRSKLFDEFREQIGLKPAQIANASSRILSDITERGGMHPQKRAERIKEIGAIAISECDGDIKSHLLALPVNKARTFLKKFPSVGDPGADRILLFSGVAPQPCLDSNGMRALVRLGFLVEQHSYSQTYKAATTILREQGSPEAEWLKRAYLTLREHGRALCKRSAPICEPCPLDRVCAHRNITTGL